MTDVNQTSYGDHFAIYANTESICFIPETNIIIYVNYISIGTLFINLKTNQNKATVAKQSNIFSNMFKPWKVNMFLKMQVQDMVMFRGTWTWAGFTIFTEWSKKEQMTSHQLHVSILVSVISSLHIQFWKYSRHWDFKKLC